jgi:Domain of unknown function (DUF4351)
MGNLKPARHFRFNFPQLVMTKFPYDEFAKGFLGSLLSPLGTVQTSFTISSEVREADIYFQPNHQHPTIPALGLLGQLAQNSIILEPFRNSVKVHQIRFCMGKLFDLHAEIFRKAKRSFKLEPKDVDLPKLWILTPTLSDLILERYGAKLDVDIGQTGVYVMPEYLKTGIVVIHQLPKTPETLWFRLLGRDKVQSIAIAEVADLEVDDPFRQNALSWLGNLKVILEAKQNREPDEEELIMQLSPLYLEKIQQAEQVGEERGEARGEARGELKEAQALIRRLLNRRVGNVSTEVEAQIKDLPLTQLEELGEALLDFTSLTDLENWLSQ